MDNGKRLTYTPEEVAELLGLNVLTVYVQLRDGTIPAVKHGNRWHIKKEVLHDLITPSSEKD